MQNNLIDSETSEAEGSLSSYLIGFILSLFLTLAAYFLVSEQLLKDWSLILGISGLAVVQTIVQLIFFLHLGSKSTPSWNIAAFLFMVVILLIIVVGSLWIMAQLNYNMGMEPDMNHKIPSEGM